ncbi:MAG: hypothetical protein WC043_00480 [Pseudobdellovibrionaceae bacterium]
MTEALPHQTLVLLVTCSMDESRHDLAVQVMRNLAEKLPEAGLVRDFILFDNASLYKDHIALAPHGTRVIQSSQNVGYWSAIKWVMEHAEELMGRSYKYIYMVESDLYHVDMRALGECEKFLDENADAACVRTQEFSVRQRWRFDKKFRFLPFRKMRSLVHMHNDVTREAAWFRPVQGFKKVYFSNLHAKIPALNRMELLRDVFQELEGLGNFGEPDFFRLMHKRRPLIGVLDGGIFYQCSTIMSKGIVSGSWSSPEDLIKFGYQPTRKSSILKEYPPIEIL